MTVPFTEKIEVVRIGSFFRYSHSERFVIPSYQREYSWKQEQIGQLPRPEGRSLQLT